MASEQKVQFINMQKVAEVMKDLEIHLNNAIYRKAYDMKEISEIWNCLCVMAEVVKTCNTHQQTLMHLANQQELIKEAEELDKQPKQPN